MDFEGLGNQEPVENFYNGGLGGNGSGPGPNYGVVFGSSSLSIISEEAGGTGNFTNNPSGDTILFFLTGSAVVDVDGGFDTGFSFFYSAASNPGVVRVYDGPGATGTVLAELNLPVTPPTGSTPYTFDNWVPFGVTFSGVARSVDFGGTANQIGFDNITLGSDVPGNPGGPVLPPAAPVPVVGPLALILMTLGVMLLGWVVARR
ncbi:hypothetical protein B1808_14435 [Pseudofulvimonas gallinarii]|nr:hypothetical protein B1808_14435 [Pseudofulvimonas gallinarii]